MKQIIESRGFKSFKKDRMHEERKEVFTPKVGIANKLMESEEVPFVTEDSLSHSPALNMDGGNKCMLMSKENRIYLYNITFVKDYYGKDDLMKLTRTSEKDSTKFIPGDKPIVYNLKNTHVTSLDTHYDCNTCQGTNLHRLWVLILTDSNPRKLYFNSFVAMNSCRSIILRRQGFG